MIVTGCKTKFKVVVIPASKYTLYIQDVIICMLHLKTERRRCLKCLCNNILNSCSFSCINMILPEVPVAHSSGQLRFLITLVFPKCKFKTVFLSRPRTRIIQLVCFRSLLGSLRSTTRQAPRRGVNIYEKEKTFWNMITVITV